MVKVSIPHELQIAIMRIQVEENLTWEEACVKAATLLKTNSEEFKKAVEAEAKRIYKRRFMTQLNKARETIYAKGYEAGYKEAASEDHFHVPCSICGKPMHFSSTDENWDKIREVLYNAFKTWAHTSCLEKERSR